MPAPTPRAAPPSAPNTNPSRASSAIFMAVACLTSGVGRRKAGGGSSSSCDCRRMGCGRRNRWLRLVAAQQGAEIALHQLLNQVERIGDLVDGGDAAVAQAEE